MSLKNWTQGFFQACHCGGTPAHWPTRWAVALAERNDPLFERIVQEAYSLTPAQGDDKGTITYRVLFYALIGLGIESFGLISLRYCGWRIDIFPEEFCLSRESEFIFFDRKPDTSRRAIYQQAKAFLDNFNSCN